MVTKHKKTKARTKFRIIEDKRVLLPKGISEETWANGTKRIVVTRDEHGKSSKKSFPWTLAGLEEAKALNASNKRETKKYGADFGCLTEDEKRALGLWRQYTKEAQAQGFVFASAFEVMKDGLQNRRTTSPDFKTLARLYFDKELMRKTDGKLTQHAETVQSRLFNYICPYFADRPVHTITAEEVNDYLDTVKGKSGGRASVETRNQYLGIIKAVFKFSVEQEYISEEHNPVKKMKKTKKKKEKEPEILRVDDVRRIFAFVRCNADYHKFIPVLALGFFGGARVEERAKITYRDIFVGENEEIYISATNAKNGTPRYIYPTENLRAWFRYAEKCGVSMHSAEHLIQGDSLRQRKDAHNRMLVKLARETGITLPKNCIRHTAASCMAETQGFDATTTQMGHDIAVLLKHYRHAVTKTEAEEYFNIFPESA